MSELEFESFDDFWPYYLEEHGDSSNRILHAIGTTSAVAAVAGALLFRKKRLLAIAPFLGYGPAWIGHYIIEKNRPATFKHPLWSLMGDFKMNAMMWKGTLREELERLGISEEGEEVAEPQKASA
jgi:hypothetical protein